MLASLIICVANSSRRLLVSPVLELLRPCPAKLLTVTMEMHGAVRRPDYVVYYVIR
jgi:hypothetical protein